MDLTSEEMKELLQLVSKRKDPLGTYTIRLVEEVNRRRKDPVQSSEGGKKFELTLDESVGAEEK